MSPRNQSHRTRILFLIEGATAPSGRLRVVGYLPFLDRDRYRWEVRAVPNSIFSRPALFRAAREADLVFLHRKLFRPWEMPFLFRGQTLVYDFDDMVMLPGQEKYLSADPSRQDRQKRFDRTVAAARLIVAGNRELKNRTGTAAARTVIIPTPVDTAKQPVRTEHVGSNGAILGWIGTKGNLSYLAALGPALTSLAGRFPDMTLKMVCDGFVRIPGVRSVEKTWTLADEPADLAGMEIGLMPLPDNLWTRGKCGFKILMYMAAGLPVVASPVGVNVDIVEHGVTGFLAATDQEWAQYLETLMLDPNLRTQMGRAGRQKVEKEYDLPIWAREFTKVIDLAAGVGSRTKAD